MSHSSLPCNVTTLVSGMQFLTWSIYPLRCDGPDAFKCCIFFWQLLLLLQVLVFLDGSCRNDSIRCFFFSSLVSHEDQLAGHDTYAAIKSGAPSSAHSCHIARFCRAGRFCQFCMSFRGQEMQRFWAARLDGALQRSTVSNLFSCFSHRPQVVRTQLKNTKRSTLRAFS